VLIKLIVHLAIFHNFFIAVFALWTAQLVHFQIPPLSNAWFVHLAVPNALLQVYVKNVLLIILLKIINVFLPVAKVFHTIKFVILVAWTAKTAPTPHVSSALQAFIFTTRAALVNAQVICFQSTAKAAFYAVRDSPTVLLANKIVACLVYMVNLLMGLAYLAILVLLI